MNAAREKVRVAHARKPLPLISASFASGELSFSKVRAVTRIADPENEAELLHLAREQHAAERAVAVLGALGADALLEELAQAGMLFQLP